MEEIVNRFAETIQIALHDNLIKKKSCKAKCTNGKCCKLFAQPENSYCTKHSKKYTERQTNMMIYHDHLPGIFSNNCVACQNHIVAINS